MSFEEEKRSYNVLIDKEEKQLSKDLFILSKDGLL